nr:transposase [Candidatus Enterovibrio escacola]
MLRKRFIIEIVLDQLKNISQIAYSFQPKKPSFKMTRFNKQMLIQI